MDSREQENEERVIVYSDEEDEDLEVLEEPEEVPIPRVDIAGFIPGEDAIDVFSDGSLWKVAVLNEGEGEFGVEPGMWVTIHYKGWVLGADGQLGECFEDTTTELGLPLKFKLGTSDAGGYRAIRAIEYSLWKMKRKERAVFIAHNELGYPNDWVVPRESNLKLEIEVLDFYDNLAMDEEFTDVLRFRLNVPTDEKLEAPKQGALVNAEIAGEYNGQVFDKRKISWLLGLEKLYDLPPGIGKAMKSFVPGEWSRIVLKGEMGFGAAGSSKFNIPPDSTVTYIVALLDFVDAPQLMGHVTVAERVLYSTKLNEAGEEAFQSENFNHAVENYKTALNAVKRDSIFLKVIPVDQDNSISEIRIDAAVGIARCHLEDLNNFCIPEAISLLEKVFEEEEQYLERNDEKCAEICTALTNSYIAWKEFGKAKTTLERLLRLKINLPETKALLERYRNEFTRSNAQDAERAKKMLQLCHLKK